MAATAVVAFAAFAAVVYIGGLHANAAQGIGVSKVSVDQIDAPSGTSWYILKINASNSGPASWRFDPSLLTLTTNGPGSYPASTAYNLTSLLSTVNIPGGGWASGQVAFELPKGQVPSDLKYVDPSQGIRLETSRIPQPSAFASRINYNVHVALTASGTWVADVITNAVIQNTSHSLVIPTDASREEVNLWLVFFTGQTIEVNFWFEYLKQPPSPQKIMIDSISSSQVPIASVSPTLPITMNGWGSQSGAVVLLTVPPGLTSGTLSFSVQLSSA